MVLLAELIVKGGMVPAVQVMYWAPVPAMMNAVVPPAELVQTKAALAPIPMPVKLMVPLLIVEVVFKVKILEIVPVPDKV